MGGEFDVRVERDLSGSPDDVFDHFTRIERLTTWWPSSGETDPRPGGTYRLHWDGPDVTLRGVYEIVDRPRRLRFTWTWDHDEAASVVDLTLTPTESGTRLCIDQTAAADDEADGYREGWAFFLDRLGGVLGT